MNTNLEVKCPNCSHSFELGDVLVNQVKSELSSDFQNVIANLKKQIDEKNQLVLNKDSQLQSEIEKIKMQNKRDLEKAESQKLNEIENAKLQVEKTLKSQLRTELELKFKNENAELVALLKNQISEQNLKLVELNTKEIELQKIKFEKDNLENTLRDKIKKEQEEFLKIQIQDAINKNNLESERVIRELKQQVDEQKKLTEEMKRKQEQGSMQRQGESFEQLIKSDIQANFRQDIVSDIKTGARGADLNLEILKGETKVGSILIECKDAKDFSKAWIEKLIKDKSNSKNDIAILITINMPNGFADDKLIEMNGIWVCQYGYHIIALKLLKEMILKVNSMSLVNTNIENKAFSLYQYLSSEAFASQFKLILNSYTSMKNTLDAEKKAMEKHWKARELQLETIFKTAIDVQSTILAIAGRNDSDVLSNFENLLGEATNTISFLE